MDSLYSRYAKALLLIAVEENKVEYYKEEVKTLKTLFVENDDFLKLLSSYFISDEEKSKVLDEVYPNNENIRNFIKVIIKNRRTKYLIKIFDEFINEVNSSIGIKEGIIYSVNKLTDEQIKKISDAIEVKLNNKVELVNKIDKRLIGGIKIVVEDKIFDGSVKNKLEKLHEDLLKGGN